MTNLLIEDIDPDMLHKIMPEKFKNPETGAIRLEALINSYGELERKMSEKPMHTAPSSYHEYKVKCDHGMFGSDEMVNQRLHSKGMSEEQVQEVYDLAAEKLMPLVKQIAIDFSADREVEKLINHFGGTDQWKQVSHQLLSFGQRNLPADVLENLASSFEGVLALHRMMKSEEPRMKKDSANPSDHNAEDIQSMMRDPRYWRDKDPAFVRQVTEGFQKIYGE